MSRDEPSSALSDECTRKKGPTLLGDAQSDSFTPAPIPRLIIHCYTSSLRNILSLSLRDIFFNEPIPSNLGEEWGIAPSCLSASKKLKLLYFLCALMADEWFFGLLNLGWLHHWNRLKHGSAHLCKYICRANLNRKKIKSFVSHLCPLTFALAHLEPSWDNKIKPYWTSTWIIFWAFSLILMVISIRFSEMEKNFTIFKTSSGLYIMSRSIVI